jgi:hypothetical protein
MTDIEEINSNIIVEDKSIYDEDLHKEELIEDFIKMYNEEICSDFFIEVKIFFLF